MVDDMNEVSGKYRNMPKVKSYALKLVKVKSYFLKNLSFFITVIFSWHLYRYEKQVTTTTTFSSTNIPIMCTEFMWNKFYFLCLVVTLNLETLFSRMCHVSRKTELSELLKDY